MNSLKKKTPKEPRGNSIAALKTQAAQVWQKVQPHLGFAYGIFLLSCLIFVVYMVNQSLYGPSEKPAAPPATNPYSSRFDDATIEKVRSLNQRSSDQSFRVVLPDGRISPFAE